LGQALQLDPRLLSISLQKYLTLLDLSIFLYFLCKKKKFNTWRMPLFFLFLFKPFTLNSTVQSTVKKLMSLVFFFVYSFLILNFFCLIIMFSWHGSQVWWFSPVDSDFFSFSSLVFSFLSVFFSLLFPF